MRFAGLGVLLNCSKLGEPRGPTPRCLITLERCLYLSNDWSSQLVGEGAMSACVIV